MMLLSLFALSTAHADEARNEVSLEWATLEGRDPDSDIIMDYGESSFGIRGGYGLNSWLTVVGAWHVGGTRNYAESWYNYDDYDYDYEETGEESDVFNRNMGFESFFLHNQISAGPKVDYSVNRWLHPYATAQALVVHSHLTLSDDIDDRDSDVNIRSNGIGLGGTSTVGLEIRTRPIKRKYSVAVHFESGYVWTTKMSYKVKQSTEKGDKMPIGDLAFGGTNIRGGIGIRF